MAQPELTLAESWYGPSNFARPGVEGRRLGTVVGRVRMALAAVSSGSYQQPARPLSCWPNTALHSAPR